MYDKTHNGICLHQPQIIAGHPLFLDTPYYLGPDGPVAEEGFAIVWEALRRAKRTGIGRVILNGKEKSVALKPLAKGFVFFTLRSVAEVRLANAYFEDLARPVVDPAQVALAQKLIESKRAALDLARFTDRYQAAMLELIKAKIEGTPPVLAARGEVVQVVNLMEALQQSVAQIEKQPESTARKNGRKKMALAA